MERDREAYNLYDLASLISRTLKALGFSQLVVTPLALRALNIRRQEDVGGEIEIPQKAISIIAGAAIVGCRGALIIRSDELFALVGSLRELMLSGVRGALVLIVLPCKKAFSDPRLVTEATMVPLLEPLKPSMLPEVLEVGTDLSEAIEIPVMIQLPEGDLALRVPFLPKGIKAEPIFSKHWEFPYRWIYASFARNFERASLLREIYQKLFENFELNVISEDIKATTLISFGLCYHCAEELLESYAKRSEVSLMGLSIYVPSYAMTKPPSWLSRAISSSRRLVILERGSPLLEECIRKLALKEETQIIGSEILGREHWIMSSGELVRKTLEKVLNLESVPRLFAESVKELVKPAVSEAPPSLKLLAEILSDMLEKVRRVAIVSVAFDELTKPLIEQVLVARVTPDYDVRSRKYPVKIPADVLDVAYMSMSSILMALGARRSGFEGPIIAVTRLDRLAMWLESLSKAHNIALLILEPTRTDSTHRALVKLLEKQWRLVRIPIWEKSLIVQKLTNYFKKARRQSLPPLLILLLGSSFGYVL